MNLNDALKWLNENDETNNDSTNVCYITKMPIENEIKLKCGHSFEYEALHKHLMLTQKSFKTHSCPYCRRCFDNFIPYYQNKNNKDSIIETKYSKNKMYCNDYLTCSYTYSQGKNKGLSCNKYAHNFNGKHYCFSHYRMMEKKKNQTLVENEICVQTLKNNTPCKCKVFDKDTKLCKRHFNLKNKLNK